MAETLADISVWQGAIDWSAYAAWYRRTYPGATPKASMKATEGVGYTDPRYRDNEAGTRANGIQRVHYHWGRPDLSGPEAEADWCWKVIGPNFQPNDLVELDYEQEGFGGNYEAWKNRWLARMATYTSRHGMYSGNWFLSPRAISWGPGFAHAAVYGPTAPNCDIWQYSSSGSFPGMNGLIDSNLLLNPAIFGDAPPGGDPMANFILTEDEQREIVSGVRDLLTIDRWNNAAIELVKAHLGPLEASQAAIEKALSEAAGHPAEVPIMAALAEQKAAIAGLKAVEDLVAAKVTKDLA